MQAKVPVQTVKAEPQASGWVVKRARRILSQMVVVMCLITHAALGSPITCAQKVLSTQAGSTADSIVLLNQLQNWADMQQLLSQARLVLGGHVYMLASLVAQQLCARKDGMCAKASVASSIHQKLKLSGNA